MSFGRLERAKAEPPMSDINMTPLIDVMLVLVVIFMITAPLLASTVPLNLPSAGSAQTQTAPPAFVVIAVQSDGQIFWGNQRITRQDLQTRLGRAASQNRDTEVQLRADAAVPYGRVLDVMDLAQQAGLSRIGFVANAPNALQKP